MTNPFLVPASRRALAVLCWLIVSVASCRTTAPTLASDSGVGVDASAFGKLSSARLIELRDQNDEENLRHDIVVSLERKSSGDTFDWRARGYPQAHSLSERTHDPLFWSEGWPLGECTCFVEPTCACEPTGATPDTRSGSVSAAIVDAFLTSISQTDARAELGDAGSRWGPTEHSVHAAIFPQGASEPIHLRLHHRQWLVAGHALDLPISDADTSPVDTAYDALITALGLPAWTVAMNPLGLPSDFGDLPKATRVEITDQFVGRGGGHAIFASLVRVGSHFEGRAKDGKAHCVGEAHPDIFIPVDDEHGSKCMCLMDDHCKCECERDQPQVTSTTLEAKDVDAFLTAMSRRVLPTGQAPREGRSHTDDYPSGHVVVWTSETSQPIHLSFIDQARVWRVNGRLLAKGADETFDPSNPFGNGATWEAYRSVVHALLSQRPPEPPKKPRQPRTL